MAMIPTQPRTTFHVLLAHAAHPARETAGRQSFVRCESFLLGHAKTPRLVAAGNDPPTRRISSVELDGVCLAHGSTNSVALRA